MRLKEWISCEIHSFIFFSVVTLALGALRPQTPAGFIPALKVERILALITLLTSITVNNILQ
jgi:hypothetical protein